MDRQVTSLCLVLTLSSLTPVAQMFCVIPMYLQLFLRRTISTRE